MVRPWRRKNCGRKLTKPKISVLMVISTQLPTIMRCRIGGGGLAAGGNAPAPAVTSFSIDVIKASASALRPFDSSQRGDSGKFLRRYQTISEPTPAMMNIGRQPQAGMIR